MESQGWFLQQGNERIGPLSTEAMKERALAGGVNPRADLLWRPGMQSWMPAGAVEEFFSKTPVLVPEAPPVVAAPSYSPAPAPTPVVASDLQRPLAAATPLATAGDTEPFLESAPVLDPALRGAGRTSFILVCLIFPLVGGAIINSTGRFLGTQMGPEYRWAYLGMLILIPGLLFFAVLKRLENLGMSRAWSLALPVPFLNSWLGYRLVACPPGYGEGRKMDGRGIALTVFYWLGVLVVTGLVAIFSAGLLRGVMKEIDKVAGRADAEAPAKGTAPAEAPTRAMVPAMKPQRPQSLQTISPVSPLMAEVDTAWQEGPKALQALSLELERKRQIDRDGFSNRSQFTEWFGSYARFSDSEETVRILNLWKKADPNRPDPWMAVAEHHVAGLRIFLGAARDGTPATLPSGANREFQERLKAAQNELATAPNRQYHPSYYVNSLMVQRTVGGKRPAFEALALEAVSRFPECPAIYSEIALSLAPRHGGEPGEWEPALKRWISTLPPQRRARAYAMAITTVVNDWFPTAEGRSDVIGPIRGKVDLALYEEGIRSLSASYPQGAYFENSSILTYGMVFNSKDSVQKAVTASRGIVNLRVWRTEQIYRQILAAWQ